MRTLMDPRYPTQRAHSSAVFELLLGNRDASKWPDAGIAPREVQGIWVEVVPVDHPSLGKTPGVKSSAHRVIAACPQCGHCVSLGRLFQHRCGSETATARARSSVYRIHKL